MPMREYKYRAVDWLVTSDSTRRYYLIDARRSCKNSIMKLLPVLLLFSLASLCHAAPYDATDVRIFDKLSGENDGHRFAYNVGHPLSDDADTLAFFPSSDVGVMDNQLREKEHQLAANEIPGASQTLGSPTESTEHPIDSLANYWGDISRITTTTTQWVNGICTLHIVTTTSAVFGGVTQPNEVVERVTSCN